MQGYILWLLNYFTHSYWNPGHSKNERAVLAMVKAASRKGKGKGKEENMTSNSKKDDCPWGNSWLEFITHIHCGADGRIHILIIIFISLIGHLDIILQPKTSTYHTTRPLIQIELTLVLYAWILWLLKYFTHFFWNPGHSKTQGDQSCLWLKQHLEKEKEKEKRKIFRPTQKKENS